MDEQTTTPDVISDEVTQDGKPRKRRPSRSGRATWEIKKTLELHAAGLDNKAIAIRTGTSPRVVRDRISQFKQLFAEMDNVPAFRAAKSDVLDAATIVLLKSMLTPEKLDKATLGNCAYAARQLHDMSQISQGKPTSLTGNISITFSPNTMVTADNQDD